MTDLFVDYHDSGPAIRNVTFNIPAGERVGLIGANGAGKTTLMLAIMGALHAHGRVVVDGIELAKRTADEVRSRCGMMFQDADDQLFMPTLLDDAAFGPLNHGCPAHEARVKAQAAIAAVGLAGLEARCAHHLSGGQKRCAALATILAMDVKLLLLDEPGANLDFRSRRRLIELLTSRPEAMLLATHDLDLVRRLCTRVLILDAGQLVADGPAGQILADESLLAKHGLA